MWILEQALAQVHKFQGAGPVSDLTSLAIFGMSNVPKSLMQAWDTADFDKIQAEMANHIQHHPFQSCSGQVPFSQEGFNFLYTPPVDFVNPLLGPRAGRWCSPRMVSSSTIINICMVFLTSFFLFFFASALFYCSLAQFNERKG